jgi:hypothetical protein
MSWSGAGSSRSPPRGHRLRSPAELGSIHCKPSFEPGRDRLKASRIIACRRILPATSFESWKRPDRVKPILGLFDTLQNLWKGTQTALWPAFHSRRLLSHGYYHLISGAAVGPGGFVRPFTDAHSALMGKPVGAETLANINKAGGGAVRGVDDLLAEMKAAGVLNTGTLADQTAQAGSLGLTMGAPRVPTSVAGAIADRWQSAQ